MKIIFLLFTFLFVVSIVGKSQNQSISYNYDNAGNRTTRKIVSLGGSGPVKKAVIPAPVEDKLGVRTIKVFPNPTKGALSVNISGGDEIDQLQLVLYNADGKQLLNRKIQQGTTLIDMANYPMAYYILRIQAGDKMTEFKIIKQ